MLPVKFAKEIRKDVSVLAQQLITPPKIFEEVITKELENLSEEPNIEILSADEHNDHHNIKL